MNCNYWITDRLANVLLKWAQKLNLPYKLKWDFWEWYYYIYSGYCKLLHIEHVSKLLHRRNRTIDLSLAILIFFQKYSFLEFNSVRIQVRLYRSQSIVTSMSGILYSYTYCDFEADSCICGVWTSNHNVCS
jgi:hypothetical protein